MEGGGSVSEILGIFVSFHKFLKETALTLRVFGAQRAVYCLFQPKSIIPYHCACQGEHTGTPEARVKKKTKNVQFLTRPSKDIKKKHYMKVDIDKGA